LEWECCWTKDIVTPSECPQVSADEEDLLVSPGRRIIAKCLECPRFTADLERLKSSGNPATPVLLSLVSEFHRQKAQLAAMMGFLDSRNLEIQFLHEIGAILQTSLVLDEVLSIALTAITAGKGFGMNRAFLLLADKELNFLRGYLGVGPKDYQEAWEIWEEIGNNDLTLREMAKHFYDTKLTAEKDKFHDILDRLSVSLDDHSHIFNRALREGRPFLVREAANNHHISSELATTLGVDTFLILPLVSPNRRIGIIIADNFITRKSITPQDMQSMEILSFPIAYAIERTSLYERLHDDLRQLSDANARLLEQQELIVRMEKYALLGKITSGIAHSIRNPLMVIGGFARHLLKDIPESDPNRESLETIVSQAKHLEDALFEALAYADAVSPAMDLWDLNQLVGNLVKEVEKIADDNGVKVDLVLSPGFPVIYTDYRQIAYCIKKILYTSIASMPNGGRLHMSTGVDGEGISLEIRDTSGAGNRPSIESRIPPGMFNRCEDSTVDLSFCRVILENYCKSFTVDENDGNGRRYLLRFSPAKEGSNHE
jgi:signal transduction histidine kinase